MKTQCLSLDRISTLPQNIVDDILTLMPIRDALRTSILSKKWRYSWRSMPKLGFTDDMVEVPPNCGCGQLKKYKLVSAIFHVLLLHNGPTELEFVFSCSVGELQMDSEFDQIISYLSRGNSVKELTLNFENDYYKIPVSFFSLQGLEHISLDNCTFEQPPVKFDNFSLLKCLMFYNVEVSSQLLQRFLSKCPLLERFSLYEYHQKGIDFAAGGNKFTFVDLLQCVPSIQDLEISKYYMKYLCAGGMPHKLPTSLAHLEYLSLDVCMTDQNEISSALCLITSSPLLLSIRLSMFDTEKLPVDQQTPNNFLDVEQNSDLKLDHLEMLEIESFRNLPFEMEFVKLIMAKSPVLKKVRICFDESVSVDEEVKLLKDLVLLPFQRASPSAKLFIERSPTLL